MIEPPETTTRRSLFTGTGLTILTLLLSAPAGMARVKGSNVFNSSSIREQIGKLKAKRKRLRDKKNKIEKRIKDPGKRRKAVRDIKNELEDVRADLKSCRRQLNKLLSGD